MSFIDKKIDEITDAVERRVRAEIASALYRLLRENIEDRHSPTFKAVEAFADSLVNR